MERYPKSQPDSKPLEHVEVVRSAHGRADQTFVTVASFVVSSTGARLLTGRTITKRAASALERNAEAHARSQVVRQFPQRPRPTSPTNTRREAA